MAQATLNGTLVNDGGAVCDVRFEYGETIAYGIFTEWQPGFVTGDTFSQRLYSLRNGTTYYYRALARNLAGVAVATGTSFATPRTLPEIATMPATQISTHQGQLNFYLVNDMGTPCVVWFEYGATMAYGQESSKLPGQESYDEDGIMVRDLASGMPFHYRAVAANMYGVGYGVDMVFSTLSNLSPRTGFNTELMLILLEKN